jgi:hypothetical protein
MSRFGLLSNKRAATARDRQRVHATQAIPQRRGEFLGDAKRKPETTLSFRKHKIVECVKSLASCV